MLRVVPPYLLLIIAVTGKPGQLTLSSDDSSSRDWRDSDAFRLL